MSILNTIKSYMLEKLQFQSAPDINQVRLEILCLAGDSGDGISRESILECVKNQPDLTSFHDEDINMVINTMLHTGELITDGHQIIDPLSIVNGAKIIRSGRYLLSSYKEISIPDNTCPKCFDRLDDTGKCPNALPECWKC